MLRVQVVWSGVGTIGYTSFHFGSDDIADAGEAVQRVGGFLQDTAPVRVPGAVGTIQPEVLLLDPVTGTIEDVATVGEGSEPGTAAAQQRVSDVTQILCRLRTETYRFGRRVRGRFFWPGTAAQYVVDGNFGSTGPSQMGAALDTLIVPGVTNPLPLVVWSRPVRVDENTQTPGAASVVTDGSIWTEFASLRSRRD